MTSPDHSPDPSQLETLRQGLRPMVAARLGRRDAVEDVVQEILARAIEAFREERVREPARLGAFARGIARHVIADHFRARIREADALRSVDAGRVTAGAPSALSRVITAQELERVRSALDALSDADRDLLRLAFFDGLSPAEIATRLGEPGPRIRKRKSRALARLRRAYLRTDPARASRPALYTRTFRARHPSGPPALHST